MKPPLWRSSLHGGHSREFCDHAQSSIQELLDTAIQAGIHTVGVTEHAPRLGERFLYPNEVRMGWKVTTLVENFDRYARTLPAVIANYADRLVVLKGYEIEVVPSDSYIPVMQDYRTRYGFEYMVGSVHYVQEISIDGSVEEFVQAMEACGGLEALAVRYYQAVAQMVQALQPEVVGHLDLIRLNGHRFGSVETPAIRQAVQQTLEAIRETQGILELNTAGWRKGLEEPYPASWLVQMAQHMGVAFCLGDDSHCTAHVAFGFERAREYLLANGVRSLTVLTREDGVLVRRTAPLED